MLKHACTQHVHTQAHAHHAHTRCGSAEPHRPIRLWTCTTFPEQTPVFSPSISPACIPLGDENTRVVDVSGPHPRLYNASSCAHGSNVSGGCASVSIAPPVAPWCRHCQQMAPAWDQLAKTLHADDELKITVAKASFHVSCTILPSHHVLCAVCRRAAVLPFLLAVCVLFDLLIGCVVSLCVAD